MPGFNLPSLTDDIAENLRKQLHAQAALHRFLQIFVGGLLPLVESVVVNKATDENSTAANDFWLMIALLAVIHVFLLVILR